MNGVTRRAPVTKVAIEHSHSDMQTPHQEPAAQVNKQATSLQARHTQTMILISSYPVTPGSQCLLYFSQSNARA